MLLSMTLDQKILSIIAENPDGMTRTQIAQALGRPRDTLNGYDLQRLTLMIESGQIEVVSDLIGTVKTHFIYRIQS